MTPERKQRLEHFRTLVKRVAAMSEAERQALAQSIPLTTCEGHTLSERNACLIAFQGARSATVVGGFRQWRRQGRYVKKGEHGFMIWVPTKPGKAAQAAAEEPGEDGEPERLRFLTAYVFDVSQTAAGEGVEPENSDTLGGKMGATAVTAGDAGE